jgi:signal transduction histidine kinase
MTTLPGWFKKPFRFFSSSIRRKIIIPYALLTLVLAALGVFVVVRLVAGSFEARLKNQLREVAQVVSDEIVNNERTRLEVERVATGTVGVAEAIVNRDADLLQTLISPIIANARKIDSIIVVDTQATELIRFQRQGTGPNVFVETTPDSGLQLTDWDAVREVLNDPTGAKSAQLAFDPVLGEYIVYTIGPVRTTDGTLGAVLVGTYLRNELVALQNIALAQLTLFDSGGKVLLTTFPLDSSQLEETFAFFDSERYQQVVTNENVTLLDQVSVVGQSFNTGGDVFVREQGYRLAYAPFNLRDKTYGVYAVALPTTFITDATNQSRNILILIFSVGVVTVFGVGYFVSRLISQPILRLVHTAQAISAGDLDQRTGLSGEDEIGILANTFDGMTDELQRLLNIQEEEASKLNAILNSIADGVLVLDMDENVAIMNPAAGKILAEMEHNFLQKSLQAIGVSEVAESDANQQFDTLLDYLSGFQFRETHRFEAGQKMFSALSAPVVSPDNKHLGAVVVLRDITREHESEKLKDDFITSVSHELRTPLTAIRGYNDLLKMTARDQLDERQMEFVNIIGDNVDDLMEIIQQMLDLSQIDAGNLGIDCEPLDLTRLVKDEAASWVDKMEERDMIFVTNFPADAVWVEGDHGRLSRVLHNLIKNAHNYTLPGGRVAVNVSQNNGTVQVDVQDTGVGISEANQRFLFTKFFRAIHEEHTYEVSGAGLGLYTSKAIIEAHNGEMWMTSELNRGSTFSFSLATIVPSDYEATVSIN